MQLLNDHRLLSAHKRLIAHPIFHAIQSLSDLHLFVQNHVFSIWSMTALSKSLHQRLSPYKGLWTPPNNPMSTQMANQLLYHFESNEELGGLSMLSWYIRAMKECNADTCEIECMLEYVKDFENYLTITNTLEPSVSQLIEWHIEQVEYADELDLASAILLGNLTYYDNMYSVFHRELSQRFENQAPSCLFLFKQLARVFSGSQFVFHIAALTELCNNQSRRIEQCIQTGVKAMNRQFIFYDGVYYQLMQKPDFSQRKVS